MKTKLWLLAFLFLGIFVIGCEEEITTTIIEYPDTPDELLDSKIFTFEDINQIEWITPLLHKGINYEIRFDGNLIKTIKDSTSDSTYFKFDKRYDCFYSYYRCTNYNGYENIDSAKYFLPMFEFEYINFPVYYEPSHEYRIEISGSDRQFTMVFYNDKYSMYNYGAVKVEVWKLN